MQARLQEQGKKACLNLWVFHDAALHDLGRPEFIPSVDEVHLAAVLC